MTRSKINLDGREIEYSLRFSEEASQSRIDSKLEGITVVVPEGSETEPEQLLKKNSEWVIRKQRERSNFLQEVPEKSFEDGEEFELLNDSYILRTGMFREGFEDGLLRVKPSESDEVEEAVRNVYRDEAREILEEKCERFSKAVDSSYEKIYIRNQKTKWASCSDKSNLSFNWRIVMAPEEIVDYVVCHELAHLEVPDHSGDFWNHLAGLFPEYESCVEWLNQNQQKLALSKNDFLQNSKVS